MPAGATNEWACLRCLHLSASIRGYHDRGNMMTDPVSKCPHCGAERRRDKARFCYKCGQPFAAASSPPAPPGSSPPVLGFDRRLLRGAAVILAVVVIIAVLLWWPPPHQPEGPETVAPPVAGATLDPITTGMPDTPTPQPPGESPSPTVTARPDATATPTTSAVPDLTPTATPTTPPTATLTATATDTPVPRVFVRDDVNLRQGPSTVFRIVRLLKPGEQLTILGQNRDRDWLWVRTAAGEEGWASSQYIDYGAIAAHTIAVVPTPSLPPCDRAVESPFRSVYNRSQLGCPTAALRTVWSAWEPFEGGAMLWRDDVNHVTVFYNSGRWTSFTDQWTGQATPSRGSPPPGRRQPVRGFGWVWGNHDEVFTGLGWATDEERGVCLLVQRFQRGFAFTKSDITFCRDHEGADQFNRAAELPRLFIVAHSDGGGWGSY